MDILRRVMQGIGLRRAWFTPHAIVFPRGKHIELFLAVLVSTSGSIKAASRISPEDRFISEKVNCFIEAASQV